MSKLDMIIGIGLLVLGVLVLLGEFAIGSMLLPVIGIVLIVFGALVLLDVVGGGTLVAILSIVFGILLATNFVELPNLVKQSINIIVGVLLILMGIGRLA